MHELNRHGTLADRRGNAFDRAGADVSGGEDTGPAGLQQERLPTASPVGEPRQSRTSLTKPLGSLSISAGSHSVRGMPQ